MNEFKIDTPIFIDYITIDSLLETIENAERQGIEVCFPVSGDEIH